MTAHLRPSDFAVLRSVPTRWADEDSYGHINNAVHYQLFDTADQKEGMQAFLEKRKPDFKSK